MHTSIQKSLNNLQTDYIDIVRTGTDLHPRSEPLGLTNYIRTNWTLSDPQYYVHAYDLATDIPELIQSLNILVLQGKVLYLGISDCPAWFVTKANAYARQHGLRPFSVYQGRYSAQERDLERDIIPMCRHEGMGILAFGTLGGGNFKSPGSTKDGGRNVPPPRMVGREEQVSAVLEKVAKRHDVPLTSVALAYALQKVSSIHLSPSIRVFFTNISVPDKSGA